MGFDPHCPHVWMSSESFKGAIDGEYAVEFFLCCAGFLSVLLQSPSVRFGDHFCCRQWSSVPVGKTSHGLVCFIPLKIRGS
ncbi:hypothetical protein XELAEV_18045372mg [Xenopus laevis]|uniref:Uncharacterized protein n=1 Tax=Xenopus laevis TaxID=8355 RepID=A0A974C0L5_XENLA|nr:hypothetical protein XELAEV_18045372mg [Xenopus laevis]